MHARMRPDDVTSSSEYREVHADSLQSLCVLNPSAEPLALLWDAVAEARSKQAKTVSSSSGCWIRSKNAWMRTMTRPWMG